MMLVRRDILVLDFRRATTDIPTRIHTAREAREQAVPVRAVPVILIRLTMAAPDLPAQVQASKTHMAGQPSTLMISSETVGGRHQDRSTRKPQQAIRLKCAKPSSTSTQETTSKPSTSCKRSPQPAEAADGTTSLRSRTTEQETPWQHTTISAAQDSSSPTTPTISAQKISSPAALRHTRKQVKGAASRALASTRIGFAAASA